MPIYTYLCKRCGKEIDFWVKSIESKEEITCPHCQSKDLQRIFTPFMISSGGQDTQSKCSSCGGGNCSSCS